MVAPSASGHPPRGFRLGAVVAVIPPSSEKPLPPLSWRYFGQAPLSADARAAPPMRARPRAKMASRRSSARTARPIAALAAIETVGIEVATGIPLVGGAAGDRGGAEDDGSLRIDDGSFEEDGAVDAGYQGREGSVSDCHDAGCCRDRAQHRTRRRDLPYGLRQVVRVVGGEASGNGLASHLGATARDVERAAVERAGGDASIALGRIRPPRMREHNGRDRPGGNVVAVEDVVVAVFVGHADQPAT